METIDVLYGVFITLVIIIGIVCIVIFVPKEHKMWEDTEDCYRIRQSDREFKITEGKANFFESRKSYIYLKKLPFTAECFADDAKAPDGVSYKAIATVTLYFPPEKISISAPTFGGANHEAVIETLSEALSAAMTETIEKGDVADTETFKTSFAAAANEKMKLFGVDVKAINDLRLNAEKSSE